VLADVQLTTLLLLLLYDPEFKMQYTQHLLCCYPDIHRALLAQTARGQKPPSVRALDRITVQLFNTAVRPLSFFAKPGLQGQISKPIEKEKQKRLV
jgi:hypothetical protein